MKKVVEVNWPAHGVPCCRTETWTPAGRTSRCQGRRDRGKLCPVPLPVCEKLLARVPSLGCTSESPGEDSKVLMPRFPARPIISEYLRVRGRVNLERIPWWFQSVPRTGDHFLLREMWHLALLLGSRTREHKWCPRPLPPASTANVS